jgi:hypothetical protein
MAIDLSKPGLRGLARKVIEAISENRMTLSKWLGMKKEARVANDETRSQKSEGSPNDEGSIPPRVVIRGRD